ncbi:surfeit locus protein 2-like [Saccostrea cucullata]|uniref:surfeit locus protein 2-like n=1 Tax=Saccostrea cuccullata TaxID=36930 RepID=UPI002ED5A354
MASSKGSHVSLSKELKKLLKQFPNLKIMDDKPRIKCSLSGHEMPCQEEAIQSYIKGKKFQKLQSKNLYSYDKYKEHIVNSKKKGREHQLFCLLTLRHLNNNPEHIKRHIEGRKFTKAYARWEECQKTGEKFQPLAGKRRKDTEEELEEGETGSDVDSLSDLYPAEDLNEEEEEDSASDYDVDVMEKENGEDKSVKNLSQGQKRKKREGKKKTKKKKT